MQGRVIVGHASDCVGAKVQPEAACFGVDVPVREHVVLEADPVRRLDVSPELDGSVRVADGQIGHHFDHDLSLGCV